jgi:uncharacterized iron-regulated protein
MRKALSLILMVSVILSITATAFAAASITRVIDRKKVTPDQLVSAAERTDLVMIGEAHDSKAHHALQLSLIQALWAKKLPMAIGLEMIESTSQKALDSWTQGKLSEQEFLAVYAKNWSLDWSLYRDIFIFARDNRIPMAGLNISKELVIKVSRLGFAALTPEERKDLPQGTTCDLNNPHTAFLKSSFQEVFNHVSKTRGIERNFSYFCEAQTLRNSGMAVNIIRYTSKHPGTKIVTLAGIWHAVKNGVPEQLERNGSKLSTTVILPELPELNTGNTEPDVADYLVSM